MLTIQAQRSLAQNALLQLFLLQVPEWREDAFQTLAAYAELQYRQPMHFQPAWARPLANPRQLEA